MNFCWYFFKWGLIAGAIGAALGVAYFFHRMDDEIRCRVEQRIAEQYGHLRVKIRSATLVKGEGIEIRGLSILEPGAEGPAAELLTIDECFLACNTDLQELLTSEPNIERVTVRRPILRMTRRHDGSWSSAKLLPLPKLSDRPPEVTIENGTIEIFDPLKTPSSTLTLRDVNVSMASPAPEANSHRRKLRGTFGGDHFRQVVFEGQIDPHRPDFTISGSTEALELCPELRDTLPGTLAGNLSFLGTLRGQGELNFHVSYNPSEATPLVFDVSGRLVRGRLDDSRLPHPLTDIRAVIQVNNDGFRVDDLTARSNQASLRMSCRGTGLGPAHPLALEAQIGQLELDHQFLEALPESLQEQWHKYRPEGQIEAGVKLTFDGQKWTPEIRVRCLNVSFTHHKFPFRLEHGRGTAQLVDNVFQANLMAYSGNQMVRVDALFRNPFTGPTGWVEAKGEELPLDQKFMLALPERSRALARALDLRGTVNFSHRVWRDSPQEPYHQRLVVGATRCWIRYEQFPYSLANIRGTLEMNDGNWTIHGLEGINGTGQVVCTGEMKNTPQGGVLSLRFRATAVALEEELRDALRPAMRQVWSVLRPRGMVDLVADLRYFDATQQLELSVEAQPRSATSSIEPVSFPYRLEKLQGVLRYHGGRVTWEHFKAEHGTVKVAATGSCNFQADGGWQLHLGGLTVDRLRIDRELMQAVPTRLKKSLVELNPTGPLTLRGSFDLARGGGERDVVQSQWDVAIGMRQVNADCGVRLENICGEVSLRGGFDGQQFQSRGKVDIDSLTYKDLQFTELSGPLWIDDQRVLLGRWVSAATDREQRNPQQAAACSPLRAKLFGGTLYGDGWVKLGPQPEYGLQAGLIDADLARLTHEMAVGRQNLRGSIRADLSLKGSGRNRNTLEGSGSVQLREANVYELPLMISLLKILSIRAPDPNAFSKCDIDYAIEGEHIYFKKLDFIGDAISLLGKGEMSFQSDLRLTFTAILGRGDLGMPKLREFFTGASQQFMLIHVGGTLQNPETRKESFPGVNQALEQLQADRGKGEERK